ncbi:MAG: response regulator transcription factor [Candidatus Margulisiibacteriota bacterium]
MGEAKKILVVDDELDVTNLISLLLKSQGYKVIVATEGRQALDLARREIPDLIILDIMLPGLDGYKIARMLKFDENYSHIPIIMLTAKVQEKDKQIGLETGADEYLTKPFDTGFLLAKVKEILERKK